jgi:hypothetical protein
MRTALDAEEESGFMRRGRCHSSHRKKNLLKYTLLLHKISIKKRKTCNRSQIFTGIFSSPQYPVLVLASTSNSRSSRSSSSSSRSPSSSDSSSSR